MFNIFDKEGKEMPDEAKVSFLFLKVQHEGLYNSIEVSKALEKAKQS